jgi:hypothetical protein
MLVTVNHTNLKLDRSQFSLAGDRSAFKAAASGGCASAYPGQPCVEVSAYASTSSRSPVPLTVTQATFGIRNARPLGRLELTIPVDELTRRNNLRAFLKKAAALERAKRAQGKPPDAKKETPLEAKARSEDEKMLRGMENGEEWVMQFFSRGYFENRTGTFELSCKYWWPDDSKKMNAVESAPVQIKIRDDGPWPGDGKSAR